MSWSSCRTCCACISRVSAAFHLGGQGLWVGEEIGSSRPCPEACRDPGNQLGGSNNVPGRSRNSPGGSRNSSGGSHNFPGGSRNSSGGSHNSPGGSRNSPGGSHNSPGGSRNSPGSSPNIPPAHRLVLEGHRARLDGSGRLARIPEGHSNPPLPIPNTPAQTAAPAPCNARRWLRHRFYDAA